MPRKYRPPATKRRKSRTTTIPYDFDGTTQPSADDAALDDDAPLLAVDVADPPPEPEDRPLREARTVGERHVVRDYSYVRGEVLRIVAIVTFLMVAMAITAVLRS